MDPIGIALLSFVILAVLFLMVVFKIKHRKEETDAKISLKKAIKFHERQATEATDDEAFRLHTSLVKIRMKELKALENK